MTWWILALASVAAAQEPDPRLAKVHALADSAPKAPLTVAERPILLKLAEAACGVTASMVADYDALLDVSAASWSDDDRALQEATLEAWERAEKLAKRADTSCGYWEPTLSGGQTARAPRTRGGQARGAMPDVIVDRFGAARPGFELGRLQAWGPSSGRSAAITVDLDELYGVEGWATRPGDLSASAVLNRVGTDGVYVPPGVDALYVWSPTDVGGRQYHLQPLEGGSSLTAVVEPGIGKGSLPLANLAAVTDGTLTLIRTTPSGRREASLKLSWDRSTFRRATELPARSDEHGDPALLAMLDGRNSLQLTNFRNVEDGVPAGASLRIRLDVPADEVGGTWAVSWTGTNGRTVDLSLDVDVPAATVANFAQAQATPCSPDRHLTMAAHTAWGNTATGGVVLKCPVAATVDRLGVVYTQGRGRFEDTRAVATGLDVSRGSLAQVELLTDTGGDAVTVYTAPDEALSSVAATFRPIAEAGPWRLRVRTMRQTDTLASETAEVGLVRVRQAPPNVGRVQVHVGFLARDTLRSIVVSGTLSPIWAPRAYERFLAGEPGFGEVYIPMPTVGIRVGTDDDDPVAIAFGIGENIVPGVTVVGGFELGTRHITETWRADRSWFVGLTVSPALLDKLTKASRLAKED
jgi:hypothetical protein